MLKMEQWAFIVQIILAVLFTWANPATTAPADVNSLIARDPWESGFPATIDALANGVSLFGKLGVTAAGDLLYSVFHGTGMLFSGTFGNRMVNINTRHFSDMFLPDSANPFAAPSSDSNQSPSKPTAFSSSLTPVSQSPGADSQPLANPP